jgi:hypothetical protein
VRRGVVAALAALITVGCADLLEGVGDFSREIVHGDGSNAVTTTTIPSEGPSLRLAPVTGVAWANDGIGAVTAGLEGDALRAAVWGRGDGISPYIQASRREIAVALPGIEFPQLVPGPVTHISSQLVFDTQTAVLDVSTAAAFGMWVGEPYDLPRSEAQLAVLRVGLRSAADVDTGEFFSFQVTEGRELAWTRGEYVYQLFCRTGISEQACFAIADSTFSLQAMLGLNA